MEGFMMQFFSPVKVFAVVLLVVAARDLSAQGEPPYRNPKLPIEQRIADLLSRMTLQEKAAQLKGAWQNYNIPQDPSSFFISKKREFLPDRAAVLLADGLG